MAKLTERQKIYSQPNRRPYASCIEIVLNDTDQFGVGEGASLLLNDNHIITFIPTVMKIGKTEVQKIRACVEGFATFGEAEEAGLKLSTAIFWLAVTIKCPLRLDSHTPLPFMVYDRTQKSGLRLSFSAHPTRVSSPQKIVRLLKQIYCRNDLIDKRLLVSMELFASARLEVTERTRFLGLVSALEPIAEQQKYSAPVERLTMRFLEILAKNDSIPKELHPSLEGRIRDIKRESVMQAIYRLLERYLPNCACHC